MTKGSSHDEAPATRQLVVADSVRRVVTDAVVGSAVALVLVALAMLVAAALVPASFSDVDRVGRGMVASSSGGIVVFGLLSGPAATFARLALADFYVRRAPTGRRLKDTLIVRGQVNPAPYGPASVSAVVLGSIALLAAIPCAVLAAETAEDEFHRAEFVMWATWLGICLVAVLVCAGGVWLFSGANRRWRARSIERLPRGVLGDRGPAERVTTRAGRRTERRARDVRDRVARMGGLLLLTGAVLVFLGVYLHQSGLYAEPVTYDDDVERLIELGTVLGGAVFVVGFLLAVVGGLLALERTVGALRRAGVGSSVTRPGDRERVREATRTLSGTASVVTAGWWTCTVVVIGGWLALANHASVSVSAPSTGGIVLVIGWVVIGCFLVGARVLLESVGPTVRNRFGYERPSVPDDREFPELTGFGQ